MDQHMLPVEWQMCLNAALTLWEEGQPCTGVRDGEL